MRYFYVCGIVIICTEFLKNMYILFKYIYYVHQNRHFIDGSKITPPVREDWNNREYFILQNN